MSAEAQTLQIDTTPVKEQPSTTANAAAADATNASASATPARLNANAKSFVPVKMDETALAANSAAADTTNPKSTTKSKTDRSPKAPGATNGKKAPPYSGKAPVLPPNAFLVPNLMQPFMPGMPMPGLPMPGMPMPPFMPSPMMGHPMMMPPPMMMHPMGMNPMGMPPNQLPPHHLPPHLHHQTMHNQPPPPQVGGLPQTPLTNAAPPPANLGNMASPNHPSSAGLMTLLPASPIVATGLNGSMNVSVGNASLAALRSNAPAKFACVILIGLPSSGKTTVGRQLVRELSEDKMGWSFFSGSDYLKETTTKKAPWETTRDVFDGLGAYVDEIIANQSTTPTRGLVIDKNVKGMEDIYYLSALLKSKGLMLNGIVSFDSTNDGPLLERMGGDDGRERLKFYRAILNRIQEGTKTNNLFHVIDSSKPLADSLKALRTQVLGCSAMQNVRPLSTFGYGETSCQLVDDYIEYNRVMTAVSTYAKTPKANQFPGLVNYTPLSQRTLDERKFRAALADGNSYSARRKVDGSKFVLYHENGQLYLIPRHQRAILRIPTEAWIGFSLSSCGPFILDGELVRLSKENNREKFLAFDVLFWAEKGSTLNICRGSWKERQDRLRSYLVSETNGFFQVKTNIVIVHQKIVGTKEIGELFDNVDYPVEGIVFNSTVRREDPVLLWRPPRQVTADFRLGTSTSAPTPSAAVPTSPKDATTTHTYELEVFDSKSIPARYAPYTRYGGVDVIVSARQTAPAEGSIVTCALQFEGEGVTGKRSWRFVAVRPDLAIPIFKLAADELLDECIVPREKFVKTLVDEKLMTDPAKALVDTSASTAGRIGFGINLTTGPNASTTDIEPSRAPTLRDIVVGVRPKPDANKPSTASATEAALRQVATGATVSTAATPAKGPNPTTVSATKDSTPAAESTKTDSKDKKEGEDDKKNSRREPTKKRNEPATDKSTSEKKDDKDAKDSKDVTEKDKDASSDPKRRCCDCRREKNEADGRVDKSARHRPFYCFGCWAKVGTEFCQQCSEFAKGHRDTSNKGTKGKGSFYCEPCWTKYEERKARENGRGKKKDEAEETANAEGEKKGESPTKPKRDSRRRKSATPAPQDASKPKDAEGSDDDNDQKKDKTSRRGKRGGRPTRGGKREEADSTPGATPTGSAEPAVPKEAITASA